MLSVCGAYIAAWVIAVSVVVPVVIAALIIVAGVCFYLYKRT